MAAPPETKELLVDGHRAVVPVADEDSAVQAIKAFTQFQAANAPDPTNEAEAAAALAARNAQDPFYTALRVDDRTFRVVLVDQSTGHETVSGLVSTDVDEEEEEEEEQQPQDEQKSVSAPPLAAAANTNKPSPLPTSDPASAATASGHGLEQVQDAGANGTATAKNPQAENPTATENAFPSDTAAREITDTDLVTPAPDLYPKEAVSTQAAAEEPKEAAPADKSTQHLSPIFRNADIARASAMLGIPLAGGAAVASGVKSSESNLSKPDESKRASAIQPDARKPVPSSRSADVPADSAAPAARELETSDPQPILASTADESLVPEPTHAGASAATRLDSTKLAKEEGLAKGNRTAEEGIPTEVEDVQAQSGGKPTAAPEARDVVAKKSADFQEGSATAKQESSPAKEVPGLGKEQTAAAAKEVPSVAKEEDEVPTAEPTSTAVQDTAAKPETNAATADQDPTTAKANPQDTGTSKSADADKSEAVNGSAPGTATAAAAGGAGAALAGAAAAKSASGKPDSKTAAKPTPAPKAQSKASTQAEKQAAKEKAKQAEKEKAQKALKDKAAAKEKAKQEAKEKEKAAAAAKAKAKQEKKPPGSLLKKLFGSKKSSPPTKAPGKTAPKASPASTGGKTGTGSAAAGAGAAGATVAAAAAATGVKDKPDESKKDEFKPDASKPDASKPDASKLEASKTQEVSETKEPNETNETVIVPGGAQSELKKAEDQPELKAEPKDEAKADPLTDAKLETKPETETQPAVVSNAENKAEIKPATETKSAALEEKKLDALPVSKQTEASEEALNATKTSDSAQGLEERKGHAPEQTEAKHSDVPETLAEQSAPLATGLQPSSVVDAVQTPKKRAAEDKPAIAPVAREAKSSERPAAEKVALLVNEPALTEKEAAPTTSEDTPLRAKSEDVEKAESGPVQKSGTLATPDETLVDARARPIEEEAVLDQEAPTPIVGLDEAALKEKRESFSTGRRTASPVTVKEPTDATDDTPARPDLTPLPVPRAGLPTASSSSIYRGVPGPGGVAALQGASEDKGTPSFLSSSTATTVNEDKTAHSVDVPDRVDEDARERAADQETEDAVPAPAPAPAVLAGDTTGSPLKPTTEPSAAAVPATESSALKPEAGEKSAPEPEPASHVATEEPARTTKPERDGKGDEAIGPLFAPAVAPAGVFTAVEEPSPKTLFAPAVVPAGNFAKVDEVPPKDAPTKDAEVSPERTKSTDGSKPEPVAGVIDSKPATKEAPASGLSSSKAAPKDKEGIKQDAKSTPKKPKQSRFLWFKRSKKPSAETAAVAAAAAAGAAVPAKASSDGAEKKSTGSEKLEATPVPETAAVPAQKEPQDRLPSAAAAGAQKEAAKVDGTPAAREAGPITKAEPASTEHAEEQSVKVAEPEVAAVAEPAVREAEHEAEPGVQQVEPAATVPSEVKDADTYPAAKSDQAAAQKDVADEPDGEESPYTPSEDDAAAAPAGADALIDRGHSAVEEADSDADAAEHVKTAGTAEPPVSPPPAHTSRLREDLTSFEPTPEASHTGVAAAPAAVAEVPADRTKQDKAAKHRLIGLRRLADRDERKREKEEKKRAEAEAQAASHRRTALSDSGEAQRARSAAEAKQAGEERKAAAKEAQKREREQRAQEKRERAEAARHARQQRKFAERAASEQAVTDLRTWQSQQAALERDRLAAVKAQRSILDGQFTPERAAEAATNPAAHYNVWREEHPLPASPRSSASGARREAAAHPHHHHHQQQQHAPTHAQQAHSSRSPARTPKVHPDTPLSRAYLSPAQQREARHSGGGVGTESVLGPEGKRTARSVASADSTDVSIVNPARGRGIPAPAVQWRQPAAW